MPKLRIYLICSVVLLLTSCSSMKKTTILGFTVGASTGALVPMLFQKKMTAKSAVIGAGIGALSAYFIHGHLKDRDQKIRKETLFNLRKFDVIHEPQLFIQKGGNYNE